MEYNRGRGACRLHLVFFAFSFALFAPLRLHWLRLGCVMHVQVESPRRSLHRVQTLSNIG